VENDSAEVTSSGRSFHVCGPTTGKARLVGDGCQLNRIEYKKNDDQILIVFAQNITDTSAATKRPFKFPPHPASVPALPGEIRACF